MSKIYKTINEDGDVKNIDLLKTRISGSIIYVEAEIAVDSALNIIEAHAIAQRVHDKIEETFEEVKHIVIHVNPYEPSADIGEPSPDRLTGDTDADGKYA